MSTTELELEPDTPPPADKPRKAPAKGSSAKPRTRRPRGKPSLVPSIEPLLTTVGQVWTIRDDVCGPTLLASAHEIAVGLDAWAQSDPKVYKAISGMFEAGGAGALAFALWPLGAAIMQHHVVPAAERYRDRRAGFVPLEETDTELAEELAAVAREPEPAPAPEPSGYTYDPDRDPTRIADAG